MMRKLFIIITIIAFSLTGLLLGIYFYPKNKTVQYVKSFFPIVLKTYIRDNIFIILEKNKKIENLEKFSLNLIKEKNQISESKKIKIKSKKILNTNYELIKYNLPFYNRKISNKTVAHIDTYKGYIYIVTGNGDFYYFNNNNILEKEISIRKIDHNLPNIIYDFRFYDHSKIFLNSDEISIKDIYIDEGKLYVSYIKEVSSNCFNTSILVANLNNSKLNFKSFYTYEDCLSFKYQKEFNAQQSGGRIIRYEDAILLTVGEYRARELAQDPISNFGKIIQIDIINKSKDLFSTGHRNPQGLFFDDELNIILSTEHGPYGGDEINLIKKNKNYGWPIASYGDHYDGNFRKEAPLYKSHKKYGFEEPLFYFYPSIGISELLKVNSQFNNKENYYFVSSLKNESLYLMKLDSNRKKLDQIEVIEIGERIRDIIFNKEKNVYLMVLENSPSLGILKMIN